MNRPILKVLVIIGFVALVSAPSTVHGKPGIGSTEKQGTSPETAQRNELRNLVKKFHSAKTHQEKKEVMNEIRQFKRRISKGYGTSSRRNPAPPDGIQQETSVAIYHVPFASTGHTIEFTIANTSSEACFDITGQLSNPPPWIHTVPNRQVIPSIKSKGEETIKFTFSVDKTAPVNREVRCLLEAVDATGRRWTTGIGIIVENPDHFELSQNYPNPFNPSTTIGYQMAKAGHVCLSIFDVLGREVHRLVDEAQEPGYFERRWDGNSSASGVYYARIIDIFLIPLHAAHPHSPYPPADDAHE